MMKDPRYIEAWVDALALRSPRLEDSFFESPTNILALEKAFETIVAAKIARPGSAAKSETTAGSGITTESELSTDSQSAIKAVMPTHTRFSRASETNLATLRTLPPATNILLFTPVIIPAGNTLELMQKSETLDPFEAFGRALSMYHRRIRHVPYVAKVGFTETHEAFISQADAVITVVCEPEIEKHRSVSHQLDFAEAALDSLESKEASAANALVLVQCGANEYRLPVDASFMNVIECKAYSSDIARYIAHTIFKARI